MSFNVKKNFFRKTKLHFIFYSTSLGATKKFLFFTHAVVELYTQNRISSVSPVVNEKKIVKEICSTETFLKTKQSKEIILSVCERELQIFHLQIIDKARHPLKSNFNLRYAMIQEEHSNLIIKWLRSM